MTISSMVPVKDTVGINPYSSPISEGRKLRDAGVLDGKKPGEKTSKLTAERAEIVRLTFDPGVSESVTRPFNVKTLQRQYLCVMDDSVDHRGSDCPIAERVTPPVDRQIRCQNK